jgi:hypothetical protein
VAINFTTGGAAAAKFTHKKTVTTKQTATHEALRITVSSCDGLEGLSNNWPVETKKPPKAE